MKKEIKNNNLYIYFDNDNNEYIRNYTYRYNQLVTIWFYRINRKEDWLYADEVVMEKRYQTELRKNKLERILNETN